ncbi:MAG TPA: zinc metalloprotease HtpX [Ktedonobacterales bacterium]|nr:zinc metalloprotease HtpX [Ktedonobacterales bacterium]
MTTLARSGRPRWYKPDIGLSVRMVLTIFVLGLIYVVFGGVMIKLGYGIFAIPFALIIAGVQIFFSDKIALGSMGAKEVSQAEAPQLHDIIGRLAAQADLPMPKVYLVNTSLPNAFATGRDKNHAVVAVTTGLINNMSGPELEAVIAHELTHVLNRDMLVMTIAAFFSMVIGIVTQQLMWAGMWGGYGGGFGRGRRNNDEGQLFLIALLVSAVVYFLSFLLTRMLSRARELAADRGSALITGAPQNLASALLKLDAIIKGGAARIPVQDFRQAQTVNALFIMPALRGDSLGSLFSTHPSTEERVKRLMEMQRQMEQAGHVS